MSKTVCHCKIEKVFNIALYPPYKSWIKCLLFFKEILFVFLFSEGRNNLALIRYQFLSEPCTSHPYAYEVM